MASDAKGKGVDRSDPAEDPRKRTIRAGDSLLIKLPSGTTKSFSKVKPTTSVCPLSHQPRIHSSDMRSDLHLGKFGSCKASELFGQPYGLTYEILDGKLRAVLDKSISDLCPSRSCHHAHSADAICAVGGAVDEIEATNQHIQERAGAQNLTYLDIEALKKEGVSGRVRRLLHPSGAACRADVFSWV